jgi:hypothetical protein
MDHPPNRFPESGGGSPSWDVFVGSPSDFYRAKFVLHQRAHLVWVKT